MPAHFDVAVRRVYDPPGDDDGVRVLVDRLWPRGLAKTAARLDGWSKEVAPSPELRRWYGHDPAKFAEFRERYRAELADDAHRAELSRLRERARAGRLTLVTATKDLDHAHTLVLLDALENDR